MRITLLTSSIRCGGSGRIACALAGSWVQAGNDVTLLSFDKTNTPAFPVEPGIKLRGLGLAADSNSFLQGLQHNLWRLWVLHRAIRESRPEIVVSFGGTTNILALLATRRLTKNVVIFEDTDPSSYPIAPIWKNLRRLTYPWASVLACPTNSVLAWFQPRIRGRKMVIPCLVAQISGSTVLASHTGSRTRNRQMVAMGRLVHEKGFDLLLNTFARIADRHPEWSLKIIGAGPLRGALGQQAKNLNLSRRIIFTGELTNPFPILCSADLFVFSSRSEGFGLALCEAMACGLPVVSFDCPSGPANIIRHGVDGILVPPEDTEALAMALDRLMKDQRERQKLAARAPEVLDRFGADRILPLWNNLFDQLRRA